MSRSRAALGATLLLAALCGALRLNGLSLLEPDTPEYLFGAASLARFDGYREIDRPGAPLQTLRPPGLSFLLVPLTWTGGYPVIAAKLFVLAFGVLAVFLTARLAARGATEWGPPAAALVVATSPYTLLHATEVVSELPYVAVSIAAILLVTRSSEQPSLRDLLGASALLSLLPFLRTIGLALILAVGAVALVDRRRRGWWPAVAAALTLQGAWIVRNHFAGGPTYFGAIVDAWTRLGPGGFAAKTAGAAGYYVVRFGSVLLPGVFPGRPLHERMTLDGVPDLGALSWIGWIVAAALVLAAARGARARWKDDGALTAIYAALFVLVLAVYPPRHERLTWPLVPVAVALVPAGLATLPRALTRAFACAAAALVLWQGAQSAAMARDNLAYLRGSDRFHVERVPPMYFADWPEAGRWLASHAPPGSRVLTRHSDLGFTSGLLQESVRFEELAPATWRAKIGELGARYVAVPSTLFGKLRPDALLGADPVYTYAPVYEGRDVSVYEVAPNRRGTVTAGTPPSAETVAACDAASAREPERIDLVVRCAELHAASGARDEAIARLAALPRPDVRAQAALGQMLVDAGRGGEAADAFARAETLPEADLLEQTIKRGRASARALSGRATLDARDLTSLARSRVETLRWGGALEAAEEAVRLDGSDRAARETLGDVELALGRAQDALARYGDTPKGRALADALDVERDPAGAGAARVAASAVFWGRAGFPGRALDLLERAEPLFPSDPTIAARLADVRRFYGLPAR